VVAEKGKSMASEDSVQCTTRGRSGPYQKRKKGEEEILERDLKGKRGRCGHPWEALRGREEDLTVTSGGKMRDQSEVVFRLLCARRKRGGGPSGKNHGGKERREDD